MKKKLSINDEIWKAVPGYEGSYEASTFGSIRSLSRAVKSRFKTRMTKAICLKANLTHKGYLTVGLSKDKIQKPKVVHRLIAKTFVHNPENKPEVNHIDGDKLNNRFENLEWCTRSENMIHCVKMGLYCTKPFEGNPNAKLTKDKVREIRKLAESGLHRTEIAAMFGVHKDNISCIVKRKTWKID